MLVAISLVVFLCCCRLFLCTKLLFCRFKLEERTRYVDRLTNVELREARVKGLHNNVFSFIRMPVYSSFWGLAIVLVNYGTLQCGS